MRPNNDPDTEQKAVRDQPLQLLHRGVTNSHPPVHFKVLKAGDSIVCHAQSPRRRPRLPRKASTSRMLIDPSSEATKHGTSIGVATYCSARAKLALVHARCSDGFPSAPLLRLRLV